MPAPLELAKHKGDALHHHGESPHGPCALDARDVRDGAQVPPVLAARLPRGGVLRTQRTRCRRELTHPKHVAQPRPAAYARNTLTRRAEPGTPEHLLGQRRHRGCTADEVQRTLAAQLGRQRHVGHVHCEDPKLTNLPLPPHEPAPHTPLESSERAPQRQRAAPGRPRHRSTPCQISTVSADAPPARSARTWRQFPRARNGSRMSSH